MKLSPSTRFLLGTTILLVVVNLALSALYIRTEQRRSALSQQVISATAELEKTRKEMDLTALKKELAETQAQLASPQASFPRDVQGIELLDEVLYLAEESRVQIVSIQSLGSGTEKLGATEYRLMRYSLQVRANLPDLIIFLNKMERSRFTTLVMDNLVISLTAKTAEMGLQLVVYAQKT
ncbi:MAG: hypothetical protein M1136_02520 [Chloroflexi bacterium]|nr:hypothetical protein [Chloroflexota bacterium]